MSLIYLFSYGTLRLRSVQLAQFGRELGGEPDELVGYAMATLVITDPDVIAVSGSDRHPVVRFTGDPADRVAGSVFVITAAELAAADEYEVADYVRMSAPLASGLQAWVYIGASTGAPDG
ncbi:gamma-glutamylcyclotransferase family protein [Pseudonocardia sp. GCM10023141]|uniref:gamma-glutamylcyclotransferase family protein n=1 Tax=Pseudonocardia sp. GCM10023141 TaxID=3252653 RepID=UPI0036190630